VGIGSVRDEVGEISAGSDKCEMNSEQFQLYFDYFVKCNVKPFVVSSNSGL
jgi:hypothetical protein